MDLNILIVCYGNFNFILFHHERLQLSYCIFKTILFKYGVRLVCNTSPCQTWGGGIAKGVKPDEEFDFGSADEAKDGHRGSYQRNEPKPKTMRPLPISLFCSVGSGSGFVRIGVLLPTLAFSVTFLATIPSFRLVLCLLVFGAALNPPAPRAFGIDVGTTSVPSVWVLTHLVHHHHRAYPPLCTTSCCRREYSSTYPCGSPLQGALIVYRKITGTSILCR